MLIILHVPFMMSLKENKQWTGFVLVKECHEIVECCMRYSSHYFGDEVFIWLVDKIWILSPKFGVKKVH